MANWMEGSLKLRGKSDDILRFLNEGLKNKPEIVEETEEHYGIYFGSPDCQELIYILDTDRAYVNSYAVSEITLDKGNNVVLCISVQQAWDFRVEDWIKTAMKYDLDVRLFGIEGLGGFMHHIDILNGEVVLDECLNYGSYESFVWNCPFPWMGG